MEDSFDDQTYILPPRITHLSRDSELNRSKGKLENFISHAVGSNMKSILNRFTSKDSNEGRSSDNPNDLEDIRKKPSHRSQNKAEAELARINKTIHWINITAKVGVTVCDRYMISHRRDISILHGHKIELA